MSAVPNFVLIPDRPHRPTVADDRRRDLRLRVAASIAREQNRSVQADRLAAAIKVFASHSDFQASRFIHCFLVALRREVAR